jgi:Ca2+-transporting ATPase
VCFSDQRSGGHGLGVVVGTGKETEFGAIWAMMKDVETTKTPLQVKMEQLGKQLSVLSVLKPNAIIYD